MIWLLRWQLSNPAIKPEAWSILSTVLVISIKETLEEGEKRKKEKLCSNRTFPNLFLFWFLMVTGVGLARDYPNCLWAKSGLYPGQVSSLSHLHSYSDLRPIQNSKFTSCASLWTLRGSWTTLEETHWTQEERVNSTHLFNFRLEK